MPCWFYDKNALYSTPSIQDGIDHKTECQYRKEGAQLIIQIGSQMELGYNTLATGIVYFHRFYMFHSFKTFSPYITACCCLFLAGKAEETPKKSKDIIKIAKKFLSQDKILSLGEDPREEVMTMEKILLQTMKFDLKVRHPYCFLLKYAKFLKGDKRKMQQMVQMAWTFINDSLCTTLSIQWEPEIIAIAVMYLAGKLVRFKVNSWNHRRPSQTHWWEIFVKDLTLDVVEDICHQVLDLYSPLSRYAVVDLPKSSGFEPNNSVNSKPESSAVNTDINVALTDSRLENVTTSVIAIHHTSLKDPRLESGSIFVKSHVDVNTSNTPIPVVTSSNALPENTMLTPSPVTAIALQSMDQSLRDNSKIFTKPITSLAMKRDPRENSKLAFFMAKLRASPMSSAMDPLATDGQPMFKRGFNNVNNLQSIENRGFGTGNRNSNNDYIDNRLMKHKGFGCASNDSNDYVENGLMENQGFRNYSTNRHSEFGKSHFRRGSFENNNYGDGDDHVENRPMGNRGFRNASNNNNRYNENKLLGNRGFGNGHFNSNHHFNENRLMGNRGFRNTNNDSRRFNESKPLGNRGFGNAENYNNNCNGNYLRLKMRYNRANHFQRSGIYPRRFNNNHENDRYCQNDETSNDSKGFISDAPGKVVDKQRFYQPSKESANDEEESWD